MGPPFGGSQQKYSTGSSFPNRVVNTCPAFRGLILKIYLLKLANIFVKIIRYILPNHKSIPLAAAFEIVLKTLVEIYGVRFSRNSRTRLGFDSHVIRMTQPNCAVLVLEIITVERTRPNPLDAN